MKSTGMIPGCTLLLAIAITTSIYSYSIKTIGGNERPLITYQGKKMLFITLPVTQNSSADSMLYSIDSLGDAHEGTLKIIGVPSYEDGYTNAQKNSLRQWYRTKLDSSIVITEGMKTRKTSSNQAPLFAWLTNVAQNGHFDEDVTGPGMKFFIRENGELFGVLKQRTRLSNPVVDRMLQSQ